jgi:hypothetical protein
MSWLISSGMPLPGGPRTSEAAWEFAATRDDFWRHMADAMAEVFQQAANASHFMGEEMDPFHRRHWWPPSDPSCPPPGAGQQPIDIEKLKSDLESFSKEEKDRIAWAVQCLDRLAGQYEQNRKRGG